MADTTDVTDLIDADKFWAPTALSEWLQLSNTTANKLALILNITPRAAYALARGNSDLVKRKTLIAVSDYTGLSIDNLIRPYHAAQIATDTGSAPLNLLLAKIGKYLHTKQCEEQLAHYVHSTFLCHGSLYQQAGNGPIDFAAMCDANNNVQYSVTSVLLSAHFYTPNGEEPTASRQLHTYWRAMVTDGGARTTTDSTFLVLGLEKSISEMSNHEKPQLVTWWWHRPAELLMDLSDQRIDNIDDLHREVRTQQLRNS